MYCPSLPDGRHDAEAGRSRRALPRVAWSSGLKRNPDIASWQGSDKTPPNQTAKLTTSAMEECVLEVLSYPAEQGKLFQDRVDG